MKDELNYYHYCFLAFDLAALKEVPGVRFDLLGVQGDLEDPGVLVETLKLVAVKVFESQLMLAPLELH